jgi:hypothetical protein
MYYKIKQKQTINIFSTLHTILISIWLTVQNNVHVHIWYTSLSRIKYMCKLCNQLRLKNKTSLREDAHYNHYYNLSTRPEPNTDSTDRVNPVSGRRGPCNNLSTLLSTNHIIFTH